MNHYTYVIHNQQTGRYYIGVRSCKCDPQDDTNYWGSSSYLDAERAHDPENWLKYVIKTYETRDEAGTDEYSLTEGHIDNGVCVNQTRGGHNWYEYSKATRERMSRSATRPSTRVCCVICRRDISLRVVRSHICAMSIVQSGQLSPPRVGSILAHGRSPERVKRRSERMSKITTQNWAKPNIRKKYMATTQSEASRQKRRRTMRTSKPYLWRLTQTAIKHGLASSIFDGSLHRYKEST
jgi:hypothetical protein